MILYLFGRSGRSIECGGQELERMATEDISPRYVDFDLWDNIEALRALYESQLAAVASLGAVLPALAAAVEHAVPSLRAGGRIVYAGAGTSGRIAVQDGAELAPTFNWPSGRVAFAMAGGEAALLEAIENAEDMSASGAARMSEIGVGPRDVVIGLAASGETAFTVAAIEAARAAGAITIGIANTPGSRLLSVCDHPILLDTGPEPIAGSTRLKAGTAQKVALNLISTLVMVRLGKVYGGLMVHMRPTNEKLRRRAKRMVMTITGCNQEEARAAVTAAAGDVKLAVLIACGVEIDAARALLEKHDGNLRFAMSEATPRRMR
jgi:N-acetylmuramic acid 6-phosphate etherase